MAEDLLKIHLGCGDRYLAGWFNVDLYAARVDWRADLREFACAAGRVSDVLAVHVLEHLERDETVALIGRAWHWLRPGGQLVIEMPERDRCLLAARCNDLHESPKQQLLGVKGLMGGRSRDKDEWHRWLVRNRKAIVRHAEGGLSTVPLVPKKFLLPGEQHVYIWSESELADVLRGVGFSVSTTAPPEHHGGRTRRDCRWVGVKPK